MPYAKLVFSSEEGAPGYSFTVEADFVTTPPDQWTDTERKMARLAGEAIHSIKHLLGGGLNAIENALDACRESGCTEEEVRQTIASKNRELESSGQISANSPEHRELMNNALGGLLGPAPVKAVANA